MVVTRSGCGVADPIERADDRRALVFDVVQAGSLSDAAGFIGLDAELQPQRFGADGNGLASNLWSVGGGSEDIHDVDLDVFWNVEKRTVDALSEKLAGVRVDWDDSKPPTLEPGRHRAAGFERIPRRTYHGNCLGAFQDLP